MSKTIDEQISKCRRLIAGVAGKTDKLRQLGVDEAEIVELESNLSRLADMSRDCDEARQQLHTKVEAMHTVSAKVKDTFLSIKGAIKKTYPQEEWNNWGIDDKR